MIERTFFMVGNGLFILEETGQLINVYDCGSSNQANISKAINRMPTVGSIDNLFISHYDKDHVNGLLTLFSKYHIHTIILPMIPNLSKVVNCSSTQDTFLIRFIQDPIGYIQDTYPETKVVLIGEDLDGENGGESAAEYSIDNIQSGTIILREKVSLIQDEWLFIIYNRRIMEKMELQGFLTKLGLPASPSTHEIIKALQKKGSKKNKNKLKTALSGVFTSQEIDSLNDYSMTVWSGPKSLDGRGALFTGDFNGKKHHQELLAEYSIAFPATQVIQIPHHGSINNFSLKMCRTNCVHVISADPGPYKTRSKVDPRQVITQLKKYGFTEEDTRYKDVYIPAP